MTKMEMILAGIIAFENVLAAIPFFQANSTFQAISALTKTVGDILGKVSGLGK